MATSIKYFIWFPFHPSSWLFSSLQLPKPTLHPPYNLYAVSYNFYAVSLLGPQEQRTEDRITAASYRFLNKGLPQKGGVGSTVIAMVNMPPKPQQRKEKPKTLHCAPRQNPHRICKNVLPAPQTVNSCT